VVLEMARTVDEVMTPDPRAVELDEDSALADISSEMPNN
jgi:hypothetical protein